MKRKTGREINKLTQEILFREKKRDDVSAELFEDSAENREAAVSAFSDYSDEIEELREDVDRILARALEQEVMKDVKNRRKNKRDAHS